MFGRKGYQNFHTPAYRRSQSMFVDKEFQLRYTVLLMVGAFIGLAVVLAPVYYFLNDNYRIFSEIAYDTSPSLIDYLEREQIWINLTLSTAFVTLIAFIGVLGFRSTNRMVGPLGVLKNHLKLISRGKWNSPEISVRDDDEFQEVIESYNYFYTSFQNHLKKDLENLKSLQIDPRNDASLRLWQQMIAEKTIQLDLPEEPLDCPVILISEDVARSHDSRHAS